MTRPRIWVDVESAPGTVTGDGPIVNVIAFSMTRRKNQAGSFSLSVPATDPRAAELLTPARSVQVYTIVSGAKRWIGGGVIQKVSRRVTGDGMPVLTVSGPDILAELTHDTVGVLDLDGSGDDNLDDVLAELPAAWSSDKTGTTPDFAARFVHETPLGALTSIADKVDAIFRVEVDGAAIRNLEWYNTHPSTSVAVLALGAHPQAATTNAKLAIITAIEPMDDSADLVNTVYVYGAGNGEDRLSLGQVVVATHEWPDDATKLSSTYSGPYGYTYSYSAGNDCIAVDESVTAYGTRARAITFSDIGPLTNSSASFDAAMNTLIKAAVTWVSTRAYPQEIYNISVAGLRVDVLPGDIVTVDARLYRDGTEVLDINNENLIVLEIETMVDADGSRTHRLTCGSTRRYPMTDAGAIVGDARQSQVYNAIPQLGTNIDTIQYREPMDDNNYATLYFWLAEEVTFVKEVILRFKVLPFNSMLGYWSGGAAGTAYTNVATPGLTIANKVTGVSVDNATTGISVGAHTSVTTDSQNTNASSDENDHTHSVSTAPGTTGPGDDHNHEIIHTHTIDSIAHSVTDAGHTHGVTDPGHNHTGSVAHRHTQPWGYIAEDNADTYNASDLEFSVNGGAYGSGYAAISGAAGWYELDITSSVRNSTTFLATAGYNYVTGRIKAGSAASKTCQIQAQIQVRAITQTIASY